MTLMARVLFPQIKLRKDGIPSDFLHGWLSQRGLDCEAIRTFPGNKNALISEIKSAARDGISLVVLCGGTGLGPQNVVPQALASVTDYEAQGIGEFMRAEGAKITPKAWLGRGGCWIKDATVYLSVSGGTSAMQQQLGLLGTLISDVLRAVRGECKAREGGVE